MYAELALNLHSSMPMADKRLVVQIMNFVHIEHSHKRQCAMTDNGNEKREREMGEEGRYNVITAN